MKQQKTRLDKLIKLIFYTLGITGCVIGITVFERNASANQSGLLNPSLQVLLMLSLLFMLTSLSWLLPQIRKASLLAGLATALLLMYVLNAHWPNLQAHFLTMASAVGAELLKPHSRHFNYYYNPVRFISDIIGLALVLPVIVFIKIKIGVKQRK